ncbi:MAG: hypothetical protein H7A23_05030 [Leptospiraceae bacterium]|nr:hypothetical protein [Leptospiraceae bacterium]MCP5493899.1 hypothetical protein [Leptospiraceae bacterium]
MFWTKSINKESLFAVECKLTAKALLAHIPYFKERTKIKKFYQVHLEGEEEKQIMDGVLIVTFLKFCKYEKLV